MKIILFVWSLLYTKKADDGYESEFIWLLLHAFVHF